MLEKLKAEQIMLPPRVEISLEDSAKRVRDLLEESKTCHLPVTVNNEILGIVSREDAVAADFFEGPGYLTALDFMQKDFVKVNPDTNLRDISESLVSMKNDCVAVVGKRDELLGVVHVHDVLRRLLHFHQAKAGKFLYIAAA